MSDDPVRWRGEQDRYPPEEERERYRGSAAHYRRGGGSEYGRYGRDFEGDNELTNYMRSSRGAFGRGGRDYADRADERRYAGEGYAGGAGQGEYGRREYRREEYGPSRDEGYGRSYRAGGYGARQYSGQGGEEYGTRRGYGGGYGPEDYGRHGWGASGQKYGYGNRPSEERGWWDRTTDEVSSWFGDEDAQRRRHEDEMRAQYRGRGPRGYTRSDDRIREDVSDRLTDDPYVDASEIEVTVSGCEVTLNGTVDHRLAKRRAEDISERVSGVTHVQNNLRIRPQSTMSGYTGASGTTGSGLSGSSTGTAGTTGSSALSGSTAASGSRSIVTDTTAKS